MDKSPLVNEQIAAGGQLIQEVSNSGVFPVQAAFWLTERDSQEWYLYLASDHINDSNFDLAYGEVWRVFPREQAIWLDPFQVKVLGTDAPVAKAVLELMKKYPGEIPMRYHGRLLGNLSVDEACIYPISLAVSHE